MRHFLLRFLPIWVLAAAVHAAPLPVVAIQPLGPVKAVDIERVKAGITSLYGHGRGPAREGAAENRLLQPRDRYKADDALFSARLVKVVNHEPGHTWGPGHCEVAGCLMQDAKGKIATMDGESGKPGERCSDKLPLKE